MLPTAEVARLRAVLSARDRPERRALLADALVEHGPGLLDTIAALEQDDSLARSFGIDRLPAALSSDASQLLAAWLVGDWITERADEAERRLRAVQQLADASPDDPFLDRLVATAMLRLPDGHDERDVERARAILLSHLDASRRRDDLDEELLAGYSLLKYRLLSSEHAVALLEQAIDRLNGDGGPAERDFLEGAHDYCVLVAAGALENDARAEYALWMQRASNVLTHAERFDWGDDRRIAGMRGRHLDIAGEAERAVHAYRELVDREDPTSRLALATVVSEATLRHTIGEFEAVAQRLAPFLPILARQYVDAVSDHRIADTGNRFGHAATLLASALAHLGELSAAVEVIDLSKSLRLRHRVERAGNDGQDRLVGLERAILTASRAGELVDAEEAASTGGSFAADLPVRTRLVEEYRRLQSASPTPTLHSPSLETIREHLGPEEAAIVLMVGSDATTIVMVSPNDLDPTDDGGARCVRLTDWPNDRWQRLLATSGGWLGVLDGHDELAGPAVLTRLLDDVDQILGRPLITMVRESVEDARRLVIVPHRWLHLIPFWALRSFDGMAVEVVPSAAELVRARRGRRAAAGDDLLVICDPTGDLPVAASEAESVANIGSPRRLPAHDRPATSPNIAAALKGTRLLHFSGHGVSDYSNSDRSALLVAPTGIAFDHGDPFGAWMHEVDEWSRDDGGDQIGEVAGVGRLRIRNDGAIGREERWLERGERPTLYTRYEAGRLVRLGELWTAGDILLDASGLGCELAFLSACESGHAAAADVIDEYGGLPLALRLAGVETIVCSMWSVDECFAALFADAFYHEMLNWGPPHDVRWIVRNVSMLTKNITNSEAVARFKELAERVRERSPRAAFKLEAYAHDVRTKRGSRPFDDPWHWASFYVLGSGIMRGPLWSSERA